MPELRQSLNPAAIERPPDPLEKEIFQSPSLIIIHVTYVRASHSFYITQYSLSLPQKRKVKLHPLIKFP